jgi:hypothetical protein
MGRKEYRSMAGAGIQQSEQHFPVRLTRAQRKVVAQLAPEMADRLKLNEPNQRSIIFTCAELRFLNSVRHALDAVGQALEGAEGFTAVPARERVFQFKITLLECNPPIWRRIQAKDCTLDRLHEHLQTAMGWTNSHLHDFRIEGKNYGDPLLLEENFEQFDCRDSTSTMVSDILPRPGNRFSFEYLYDFGDRWRHDVLFEGVVRAGPGLRYPFCVEGARACPPEDVGGTGGYEQFLEALADRSHSQHAEYRKWIGGRFNPERFDVAATTRRMRRGLPDWRRMA